MNNLHRCLSARVWPRALALLLAAATGLPASHAANEAPPLGPLPVFPTLARTASRGAWVVATNNLARFRLLRWADARIDRIEQLTGITRTREGRTLRIIQQPSAPDLPAASGSQRVEHGLIAQTLLVRGPDDFEREAADGGLCQLLVYGYVLDHWAGASAGRSFSDWVAREVPQAVPTWLWRGLAGCLDADTRAASSDHLLATWRTGTLTSLVAFLRTGGTVGPSPEKSGSEESPLQRAYEIMLVSWLLNQPDPARRLDALCARMAVGETLGPERLAASLPDCASVVDLEEQWDAWILSQGRMILAPGRTRSLDLVRLKEALILDRALLGIPEASGFPARGTLRDLLAFRDAPWIPTVASSLTLQLRTLALGKGPEFQNVIEGYCAYLTALAARKPAPEAEQRLGLAEELRLGLGGGLDGAGGGAGPSSAVP